jgi:hypothetical protein
MLSQNKYSHYKTPFTLTRFFVSYLIISVITHLEVISQDNEEVNVLNDIITQIEYIDTRLLREVHPELIDSGLDSNISDNHILKNYLIDNNVFERKTNKGSMNYLLVVRDTLFRIPEDFLKHLKFVYDTTMVPSFYPINSFLNQSKIPCLIDGLEMNSQSSMKVCLNSELAKVLEGSVFETYYTIGFTRIYLDDNKKYAMTLYSDFYRGINLLLLKKEGVNWYIVKKYRFMSFS